MSRRDAAPHDALRPPSSEGRSAKVLIVAVAVVIGAFVAYMALGMPGMDHSTPEPNPGHQMDGMTP